MYALLTETGLGSSIILAVGVGYIIALLVPGRHK